MKICLPVILFLLLSCGTKPDKNDYQLGAVGAFAEMVDAGVKKLALSAPLVPDEMDYFEREAEDVAARNGCKVFRESELIVTDLFPPDVAKGKDVLLIYKSQALEAYEQLKADQQELIQNNAYGKLEREEIARRFGRLLSYSPQKINRLLAENSDFRTLTDFGIEATNTFLYYEDLPKATKFYTETIGLELVADYQMASILRVSSDAFIILVDAAKGMHTSEEPKTVALALLTEELGQWYAHLRSEKVPFRYPYKPSDGGPHDGFVVIDPEGYLLEFETFKQHEENEAFMPLISKAPAIKTSTGLSFNGSITWVYHKDLLKMQRFYETVMGLSMVIDQGWTKVYQVSNSGFLGIVDEKRGMHSFTEEKAVTLSFWLQDLDGWYAYVRNEGAFELRSEEVEEGPDGKYRAFVGYGPEGYFLEFDRFYEHNDNSRLLEIMSNN
jgi:catechol-2,3-dioxygenase